MPQIIITEHCDSCGKNALNREGICQFCGARNSRCSSCHKATAIGDLCDYCRKPLEFIDECDECESEGVAVRLYDGLYQCHICAAMPEGNIKQMLAFTLNTLLKELTRGRIPSKD